MKIVVRNLFLFGIIVFAILFGGALVTGFPSENSHFVYADVSDGGICGENLTWTIDGDVLTIIGTGNMNEYGDGSLPWSAYATSVSSVVIGDGVTSLSGYSFKNFINLSSIDFGTTLNEVGKDCFSGCTSLQTVVFPENVRIKFYKGCMSSLGSGASVRVLFNSYFVVTGTYVFTGDYDAVQEATFAFQNYANSGSLTDGELTTKALELCDEYGVSVYKSQDSETVLTSENVSEVFGTATVKLLPFHHNRVEPTINTDGNIEYWEKDDGIFYADEDCVTLIEDANDDGVVDSNDTVIKSRQAISPSINISDWVYGDDANVPTISGNSGNGNVVFSYKLKDADDSDYVETIPSNVGYYTARAIIEETDEYYGATVMADFVVAPKVLTITADGKSKVYGQEDVELTYQASGLVLGDEITGELAREIGENVGSYAISQNTLSAGGNYEIVFIGTNFVITQKEVGLVWSNLVFTYDGVAHVPTLILSGVVGGDECLAEVDGQQINASLLAYTAQAVSLSNNNYKLPSDVGVEFIINKRQVSVVPVDKTTTYLENDVALTYIATGLVAGETLEGISLSRTSGDSAGEYVITAEHDDEKDLNYIVEILTTARYTILQKEVVPTVVVSVNKMIYDGEEKTPDVVVKDGDVIIPAGEYIVEYENNVEVGQASVIVKNRDGGNYAISQTIVNFEIKNQGKIELIDNQQNQNVNDTKIEESAEELLNIIGITDIEREIMEQEGENLSVYLEVVDISETISSEDSNLINTKIGENEKLGTVLDINLFKKISGFEATKVASTTSALKISFEVPESLINKDSRITRKYKVLRVHNGVVEELATNYENGKITFETDRFSTYALSYVDSTTQNVLERGGLTTAEIGIIIVAIIMLVGSIVFCVYWFVTRKKELDK